MERCKKKAILLASGVKVKVIENDNGLYRDVKTNHLYFSTELKIKEPKTTIMIGKIISKIGIFFFARQYIKYKSLILTPCMSIDYVNGYDRYIDIEIKFLVFGVGMRVIKIISKKDKNKR